MLQLLALAYLRRRSLDSSHFSYIFDAPHLNDLETICRYFWSVSNQPLSAEQKGKIIALWAECLARTQHVVPSPIKVLASLSLLSCFMESIGEREERLLIAVAPYVEEHFHAHEFLEELNRLVDTNPVGTSRVFGKMLRDV